MENFIGYSAAILIGVTLGMIGAGGSLLTVPVLVYLLHVSPVLATSYSLFTVGVSALAGSFSYMKKKLLNYKTSIVFGIPSLIGVFVSRKFLLPIIPCELLSIGNVTVTKDIAIMVLFAALMIAASCSMIKKSRTITTEDPPKVQGYRYSLILTEGLFVGVITGLVGAGGGFLIIPALILLMGESMKIAIGTSLLIIAAKSLIGFAGDLTNHMQIEWRFLLLFSLFTILGILPGAYYSKYFSETKLKYIFGWVLLLMGIYIIAQEILNP